MSKLFKDILMEVGTNTYDISKLLWLIGVLVFLALSVYAVMKGQLWDPQEYGIGMGVVLAGGGVATKFKTTQTNSTSNNTSFAQQNN
jgi:hypothetical protein